jgi:exopolysaccharide biosynthesis polyprenyl glycosylphosphotransferase
MKSRSDVGLAGPLRLVGRPRAVRAEDDFERPPPPAGRRARAPEAPSGVLRRYHTLGLGLAASDVLALVVALVLSYLTLFSLRPLEASYYIVLVAAPLLWIAIFHTFGLYAPHHLSASEEFRRTIGAASVGIMLIVIGSYWWEQQLPRQWVALTWFFALVLELIVRRVWRWYAYKLKADGRLALRTLIVGTNDEAGRLAQSLRGEGIGFDPLGYVATTERLASADGLPVVGRIDELEELIEVHAADCVFVASTAIDADDMLRVVQTTRLAEVEARVSANLPQLLTSRLTVQPVGHVMALSLKPVRLTGTQTVIKRAFDLTVASVGLLCILPLWLLIAVLIRVTSKGSVLFRQERVTKGGRTFTVYKFRTMVSNAAEVLERRGIDPSAPFFKLDDDPRLTRVGRILRKLSLDELPQLLNVLRGDMSLVGPRPLPAEQVAANLELLSSRHEVPAGVTGWWQINGRSHIDFEEAVRMDLFYIENWSLSLDLYILLKTVGCVLAQRGAH